ncbi:MAG TPA: hypothetical protein VFZ61_19220 [Polyangiales bacterium]
MTVAMSSISSPDQTAPSGGATEAPDSGTPQRREATHWHDDGWTARVIKNEDDDGWAVEMTRDGELEPALVGPWTMGRDKKNPKPLDAQAFAVLVKAANEVRSRHLQQLHAQLHRNVTVELADERVRVDLDVQPDEDDPHAVLTVHFASGPVRARVEAGFKLSVDSARRWIAGERRG